MSSQDWIVFGMVMFFVLVGVIDFVHWLTPQPKPRSNPVYLRNLPTDLEPKPTPAPPVEGCSCSCKCKNKFNSVQERGAWEDWKEN